MKQIVRFVSARHARPKSGRRNIPRRLMATVTGSMSTFGGPGDAGVAPAEGLALMTKADVTSAKFAPLFELEQPVGSTGLARRLDAKQFYIAMRWATVPAQVGTMGPFGRYLDVLTPLAWLRSHTITVSANGKSIECQPTDFGPNGRTGRIADISPGAEKALGLRTDDVVTVGIGVGGNATS